MKIKTVIIFFGLLLTGVVIFANAADTAATEKKPVKCPGRVKVLVEKITPSTFLDFKELEKRISPSEESEIKNHQGGIINKIEKKAGSEVKTGDIVLTLETAKIEKEIEAAKANIKKWERILLKRRQWKVRSEQAENQAEGIINNSKNAQKEAEARLALCIITSPADGVIGDLYANEGDHISEGFAVGNVIYTQRVKVSLNRYTAKMKNGQEIKINIKEISKNVNGIVEKTSDKRVYIYIDNKGGEILIGMTANFSVLLKKYKNAMMLPQEKILNDETGSFVYTVNGKLAKKSMLKTGPVDSAGKVLILEGLSADDEIIVSEVLSAKQGTLREKLTCLYPNKKIKIVEFNDAKGRYVTRKKGKQPVKKVTKEEKKIEAVKPVIKVEKKKIPVKKEKITKKAPKEEKKKEVKKEEEKAEEYPKVKTFIAYLYNNKDTLGYKKFKKVKVRGGIKVLIYCNAAARNKLLNAIHKLDVEKYCILKIEPGKYELDVFFKGVGEEERVEIWKPKPVLSKFRVGAIAGYYIMFDSNFNDVYGSLMSLGLDISYTFSEKLDIWLYGGLSSKKKAIDWAEEDLQFKLKPLTLDLRYFFKRDQKWDLFAGAGLNLYLFEDINPIENVKDSAFGFNILGGTYFHLTKHLSLQFTLRFNMVKKSIENSDNGLNMNSLELLFGLSYNL